MKKYDVVIIGGGPGGYVCAIRCAQLGKTVCLIEKEKLGGICLNWGCIPTKALLRSGEILHYISNAEKYGIKVNSKIICDDMQLQKMIDRSRNVSAQLNRGVEMLMKKHKISVINGLASLVDKNSVSVNGDLIQAQSIVIATGARPRIISGFEPDNKFVWTYKNALMPESLPKSLIVVGSGAIGIEFASFYNAIGVDVTLIEAQDRIIPLEDKEISTIATKLFQANGINIKTSVKLEKIEVNKKTKEVTLYADQESYKASCVLMSVGVVPNTEEAKIKEIGIEMSANGFINTDDNMRTNIPNIFAIGDVAGAPCLAHKASHEAIIAAATIAGIAPTQTKAQMKIPSCIYSYPQIASIGLTEEKALAAGINIKVGHFPFCGNGKAIALGETDGMIKTIFDKNTGEIVGVHMIGHEVTELISAYAVAMKLEGTEEDVCETIFPHPTLSEMLHESALDADKKAIHI